MSRLIRALSRTKFEFQNEIFYSYKNSDSLEITELGIRYNDILISFTELYSWKIQLDEESKIVINYFSEKGKKTFEFFSTNDNIIAIEKNLKYEIAKIMVMNNLAININEALEKMLLFV